jgi:hypothetical protein
MILEGAPSFAYRVNSNREGPVVTLANPAAASTVEANGGALMRRGGDIVPIVHMYDRFDHTASVARAYA